MAKVRSADRQSVLGTALNGELDRRLRAFIYARVSRDPRRRETSIRDQMADNRNTCTDNGWHVADEFKDPDRSASRHAKRRRPEWDEMIRRAKAGECDIIVFWESARAYRDLEVFVELRKLCLKHHVLLCYDGEVFDVSKPSDWKRLTRDALEAEEEAEKIRNRVLRTTRLSAERGAIHGKIPYGYRRVYDSATGDLIGQVEDEATAPIVREAAKRVAAGETTYKIARDFQDKRIPPPRNAKRGWDPTTINQIVLNPAVAGKRVHLGKVVGDAVWDEILDDLTYRACCRILKNPARRNQRDSAVKHLLSGTATGACGGTLRVRRNRSQHCYTCIVDFCVCMEVGKFERYVEASVLEYVSRPEFAAAMRAEDGSEVAARAAALVADLQSELDQARALVGRRELSVASLAKIEKDLLPQVDAAQEEIRSMGVSPVLLTLAGPDARRIWQDLDLAQRRAALRALGPIRLNPASKHGVRTIEPGRITMPWDALADDGS